MDFKKLIKFEPIDLTQIFLSIFIVLLIIFVFRSQLDDFFASLKDRPITVEMKGGATTIKLDTPAKPELVARAVNNPQGDQHEINNWEQMVNHVDNIEGFAKLGFGDLYEKLSSLGENEHAVINFVVNDPGKYYFNDESMLKYLSIASEKVNYMAFYENNIFMGAIKIQTVIAGLAAKKYEFSNFGEKLKNGNWKHFPGLISKKQSFTKTPSVKELQDYLSDNKLDEVPLVKDNALVGFLNYKSISSELYKQAEES